MGHENLLYTKISLCPMILFPGHNLWTRDGSLNKRWPHRGWSQGSLPSNRFFCETLSNQGWRGDP
jgi:hypothetical protein